MDNEFNTKPSMEEDSQKKEGYSALPFETTDADAWLKETANSKPETPAVAQSQTEHAQEPETPSFTPFQNTNVQEPETKEVQPSNVEKESTPPSYQSYVYTAPQSAAQTGSTNSSQSTYQRYDTYENTYGTSPIYVQDFSKPKAKKKRSGAVGKVFLTLGLCLLSLLSGFTGAWLQQQLNPQQNQAVIYEAPTVASTPSNDSSGSGQAYSLADVVAKCKPSVVEITVDKVTANSIFGTTIRQGAGSGVILSSDGYIVTNNHVVSNTSTVNVILTDQTSYTARIVGLDEENDIAVIKIDATGLTPAVFGDSSIIREGDSVFAIGNPLGTLGGSTTEGIISGLDRQINVEGQLMTLMQTSAAVNHGNSGGGLFNSRGELIGIVNSKSEGTDVEGLGFAIPSNVVKEITTKMIDDWDPTQTKGNTAGPVMGITIVTVPDLQTAQSYNVSRLGVYIVGVSEGFGAAKAGVEVGDYIVSIEDIAVGTSQEITDILSQYKVGDTIKMQVIRGENQMLEFEIELMEPTT